MASLVGRHSYVLNLAVAWLSRAVHDDPNDREKTSVNFRYDFTAARRHGEFNVENRDRDEIVVARHMESGTAPLTVWDGALRRFSELARENGFTGIVSYTPPAYATYGGQLKLADPSLAPLLVSFDEAQRRYLAERTASDGLLFFDLTPALRAAAAHPDSTGLLYGPVHVHLTARGNEVVADALSRFLEERGLVRAAPP